MKTKLWQIEVRDIHGLTNVVMTTDSRTVDYYRELRFPDNDTFVIIKEVIDKRKQERRGA